MKRIFLTFAAVAAIVSCKKAEDQIQPQAPEVTITAEHLKTVIDNDGAVNWDGDEKISVIFTHRDTNGSYVAEFENGNEAGPTARFVGTMDPDVNTEAGWREVAYCVCPSSSVDAQTGEVMHSLPAEQYAHSSVSGSFETGLNLSYAPLSLAVLEDKSQGTAMFQNALSVLRLTPGSGDITSITINASAPLVGEASMAFDTEGKLVLDSEGEWGGNSVVLFPSKGNECFTKGVTYNILVYPGAHTSFSVTLNYGEYGNYTKTLKSAPTFKPAKYYTIGFTSDSELIIEEFGNEVKDLETSLPSLEALLGNMENKVDGVVEDLLSQVQSVSLMTEYLNNAVYAPFVSLSDGIESKDIVLDYIVKPESAAQALVDAFKEDPSVVKGVLGYRKSIGYEDAGELDVNDLVLSDAPFGKYVSASVSAKGISSDFYNRQCEATLALCVKSGKTEVLSDFANLVPKSAGSITGSWLKEIPAIPGARVVIPFNYILSDPSAKCEFSVYEKVGVEWAYAAPASDRAGNLVVVFSEETNIADRKVTIALTIGEGENQEVVYQTFTFKDLGVTFDFISPGEIDYIGGEVTLKLDFNPPSAGITYRLECSGTGASLSGSLLTFSENTTNKARSVTVTCYAKVEGIDLEYSKTLDINQKAAGTPLTGDYYNDGDSKLLNTATVGSNHLNIVILGDGYMQKDLTKGGKFERNANSVVDNFFANEPFKTFKNRFNVYMVAYKSKAEGPRLETVLASSHETAFGTYYKSSGNTYVGYNSQSKITDIVKYKVGLSSEAKYYRTIVILLVNSTENLGSTDYPSMTTGSVETTGDGYASFAIAILSSDSQGTSGLVRHEAGGHAFGRLGDEYVVDWYTTALVNERHGYGFYRNVATNTSYWNQFIAAGYSDKEVQYDSYGSGLYRSTHESGVMWNNNGFFNAVSRWAIYDRIRKQTEGNRDYWNDFLNWDTKNR